MEHPIKMDDLGGFPPIFGSTPIKINTSSETETGNSVQPPFT